MSHGVVVPSVAGLAVAAFAWTLLSPPQRLAVRLHPWTAQARTRLGAHSRDSHGLATWAAVARLLGPVLHRWREWVGGSDVALVRRLDHAGMLRGLPPTQRADRYRLAVLGRSVAGMAAAGVTATALPLGNVAVLLVGLLGLVVGATRARGSVDRATSQRRDRLQAELPTATQMLAMTIRVGGGVVQTLQRFAERGHGLLAADIREVLAQHTAGVPIEETLLAAAARCPERSVARLFRLLATGASHGTDLASALLDLSSEVRSTRRQARRRDAVRRRAAMLLPTIGILAPVMLLFVAAPLPSLVFGVH